MSLALLTSLMVTVRQPVADALTSLTPGGSSSVPASPWPDAAASRASDSGSPASYRVVGLGDSVPAGSACDCTSYVSLVGEHEAELQARSASVTNLAEGGFTTADVLDLLQQPSVRRDVAAADLVIVTVGANDFDDEAVTDASCDAPDLTCYQSTLKQQETELRTVLDEISAMQHGLGGKTVVTGYWSVFLDGQAASDRGAAYVRNSTALTAAENAQLASLAEHAGDTYVDLLAPFKGDGDADDTPLLASDGDHPNAAGHQAIADAVQAALAAA